MVQRNEQARILSSPAAAHRPLNVEASSWTFQTVWTSRWSASQSSQLYTDFPCCGSWTTEPSGFWGTEIRKYSVSLSVRSLVMALAEKLTNCAAVSGQFQQVSIWNSTRRAVWSPGTCIQEVCERCGRPRSKSAGTAQDTEGTWQIRGGWLPWGI